jgi:glycosyltransferase involved in cell wall biosynthesis
MKIFISFNIVNHPAGGGNNFLRYLSQELQNQGIFTEKIKEADIILVNSHHHVLRNLMFRILYPKKLFIHRLDGKLSLHRASNKWDSLVTIQNKYVSDATIYQSNWAKQIWKNDINPLLYSVINNQADTKIFKLKSNEKPSERLVIAYYSFSQNKNKGIEYLTWLKEHQNELNIELRVIGSSPFLGRQINSKKLSQQEIANELKFCDVFFFPSKDDACSNAVLEALAIGLPILALDSGGNSEIVKNAGIIFRKIEEIPDAIDTLRKNYKNFSLNTKILVSETQSIEEYISFFYKINKELKTKKIINIKISAAIFLTFMRLTYLKLHSFKKRY